MNFPNVYTKETKEIFTNSGTEFEPEYKLKVDKEGRRNLEIVGETNVYARIQSFKDSCDVNYILQRFASGDQSALSKVQGIYGDFTTVPTSLSELSQRVIDAENLFNSLDLSVREQFNFSPSEFFASIGSEKFNAIFTAPEKPENMLKDATELEGQISMEKPVVEEGSVVVE